MTDGPSQILVLFLVVAMLWTALKPKLIEDPPGSFFREGLVVAGAILFFVGDAIWFLFDGIVGR